MWLSDYELSKISAGFRHGDRQWLRTFDGLERRNRSVLVKLSYLLNL